ncbi:MAG: CocE/NonD family hydrolase [Candidatus Acidiferrales bacterium]
MKRASSFFLAPWCVVMAVALAFSYAIIPNDLKAAVQSRRSDQTATVQGIVTDERNGRIAGAWLQFARGGESFDTKTDRQGSYEIELEPGSYVVRVQRNGFRVNETKGVEIKKGSVANLDFTLIVGVFADPVTVEPSLLDLISPEDAIELSKDQSSSVPPNSPRQAQYATMKIVQAWIPMKDGVRLAVNLYMPQGPLENAKAGEKFPAILEYLPYRKDDWTMARDWDLHSYFVRRGYVSARVDIRGTGASEGNPPDREYSEQEQQDGMEVIAWLAKQPWCNGNVGMMGISWGGFNSIQMARRHPPALKAIIAMCATEELLHDDIHYIDDLMHLDEYELGMDLQLGMTRAPDFPTDEKSLTARFDARPWALLYLEHQRDSEFWRRASLAPNHYGEYTVPSFMIGGFLDGYRDSIPRFFLHAKAPIKALIGPWNHTFPHDAEPGPSIEWRVEATRWWDYWLKGAQNGIMDEPRFEVYMRKWYPPDPNIAEIPGEWRAEKTWPPANASTQTLFLEPNYALGDAAPAGLASSGQQLQYVPSIGNEAGFWWGDLTADQRPIDAYSLVYDSAPVTKETALLGWPKAFLRVSASAPLADWFVRLSDVAPDGSVTLITGAGQGGAQRDSAANPSDLEPNRKYLLPVELHVTSWIFAPGHRIRLAISNALWPMIWPTPYAMTTALWLGGPDASRLVLPLVPLEPPARVHFAAPEKEPPLAGYTSEGDTWAPQAWTVTRDVLAGSTRVAWSGDDASGYPWGKMKDHEQMSYVVADAQPAASTVRGEGSTTVELPGRVLVWSVALEMRSDSRNFYYHFERHLTENGKPLRDKSWDETIPRDHQ